MPFSGLPTVIPDLFTSGSRCWLSPTRCPGVVYLHTAGHSPRHEPGTPGRFSPPLGPPERSCEAAAGSLRGASVWTELCGSSRSPLSTSRSDVARQRGVHRDVFLSVVKDYCVCPAPQVPELGPRLRVGTQAACPLEPWLDSRLHQGPPHPRAVIQIQNHVLGRHSLALEPEVCAAALPLGPPGLLLPTSIHLQLVRPAGQPAWQHTPPPEPLGLTVSLLDLPGHGWDAIPRDSTSCTEVLRGLPSSGPLDGRRSEA